MPPITRFAPSPTGHLHIGNARAALFCYLYAKGAGGTFLLRLDDTDQTRSSHNYADAIIEDLTWLGLVPDQIFKQSDRFVRYQTVFDDLATRGRVYPCYETAEELELKRKRLRARHRPPIYDRTALDLDSSARARLETEGHTPHWRFKLSGMRVQWHDLIRHTQEIDTASLSDPIIRRDDGRWLYTLPSVVDDIDYASTHIIRGEDHVTNTAIQIELFHALSAAVPEFGHFSLLTDTEGGNLSKRAGTPGVRDYRARGLESSSLTSLLARLGSAEPVIATSTLAELVDGFDITRLGRAPARFNEADLEHLNAKILHTLPFDAVAARLSAVGFPDNTTLSATLWDAVRDNLKFFSDAEPLAAIITAPVTPIIADTDRAFMTLAYDTLPDDTLTEESWDVWLTTLKAKSGRKGKSLFLPIRLALTGHPEGPEMKKLFPLIGVMRARARLQGETV